jgi:glycerophosphoryl diester phosphodiesterase
MTEIASHRGGALLWPENSRTAFEGTTRLQVEQVELDVHPTRDGELVVIHDPTLDRTTDGGGPVGLRSHAELSHLTLKGTRADRILTLDEVIDIFAPTSIKLRIELKAGPGRTPYAETPRLLAARLRDRGMIERSILTSFQLATVCEAAALARPPAHVFLATPDLLADLGIDGLVGVARSHGVPILGIRWNHLGPEVMRVVREAGLGIGGWAVNDEEAIARMLDLGVDVFTTDRPDLALRARESREGRPASV